MINIEQIHPLEQLFSHKGNDGKEYTIAVDRLRKALKHKNGSETIAIEKVLVDKFVQFSGIEQHRIKALLEMPITTFDKLLPPLILWFKNDQWVMADGNHQYVAAFLRGKQMLRATVATRQEWAPFIVKGYTPDYQRFSGILHSPAKTSREFNTELLDKTIEKVNFDG